jgi:MFS family permease
VGSSPVAGRAPSRGRFGYRRWPHGNARRASPGPYLLGGAATWNLTNIGGSPEAVAEHFSVNLVLVGFLTSAIFLAQALFQVPGGHLIDRFGPRRIGMHCLGLVAVCNLAILVCPNFGAALGLRFAAGVGSGIAFVAGASYIGRLGGTTLAQGMYGGVSVGAGGIAVGSVAWLSGPLGWRAAFVSAAAVAAVSLLALLRTPEGSAPAAVRQSNAFRSILADARVWRYSVIQAATFGLSILASNWLVVLLVAEKGYSRQVGGAVAALILLGGVIGRPVGGWLMLKIPTLQNSLIAVSLRRLSAGRRRVDGTVRAGGGGPVRRPVRRHHRD